MSKEKMIIVSYAPLLGLDGERFITNEQDNDQELGLKNIFDNTISGEANGCLWLLDDDGMPVALLSYDKAKEIANHMMTWADGDIADRMKLYCFRYENLYILSLFPNLEASIDRVIENAGKLGRIINRDTTEFTLVFDPIRFISGSSSAFDSILKPGASVDKIKVGLISTKCSLACAKEKAVPKDEDFFILGTFNVDKDVSQVMAYFQGCINGPDTE